MRKDGKMKKALALLLSLIVIFTALSMLSSCSGKNSDVPEGMQLVRGGDNIGYYMYAPEEWVVANQEELGIACTYVSKVNNTSVTLVEADFTEENAMNYIAEELERFPEALQRSELLTFKEDSLGNAERAWKVVYTYKYGEYIYQVMQIFAIYGERSYIFTYSASAGNYDQKNSVSYYDKFLEKTQEIIKNLKFVDLKPSYTEPPVYAKDADGFSLVSNKKLCGFEMYIPDSYKLDFATSIISTTKEDGTNITVSEATDTNTDSVGYWTTRFATLKNLGADVVLTNGSTDIKASQERLELGSKINATSLRYTVTLMGRTSYVYQVLIVKGMTGYVFTYTASEANFEANFGEMQTILNKIEF